MSENERNFRKMWKWIAEETRRQKRHVSKWEYFDAVNISEIPYGLCYACEENLQRSRDNYRDCSYCPLDWGECDFREEGSLYDKWIYSHSYEETAEFAEKIAQMEWREEENV